MESLDRIVKALDRELDVAAFKDESHNGLQVAGPARIRRVCCGVDASLAFFEEAKRRGADLLVCHHGLSWGDSLKRITDTNYRRVAYLIRNDLALYACHLPLDAHPRLGNNAGLFRALGLRRRRSFGLYAGRLIGFRGELPRPMPYARFKDLVRRRVGGELRTMDFGPARVKTVGIVSGGAASEVEDAGREGLDVYLSGEPALVAHHLAQEYRLNAVFAGHYATETFGVRALAAYLQRRFDVEAEFVDLGVPF